MRRSNAGLGAMFAAIAVAALACSGAATSQQPIKTVVVLVLENRSFDHMLGWMKTAVSPTINGLTGAECNPVGGAPSATVCVSDDASFVESDPGHTFQDVLLQVFAGAAAPSMSGFVESARSVLGISSNTVMRCFNPQNLPVFTTLVEQFAVFDRWFSSIPGPTQPNRLFVYSATSHGAVDHNKWELLRGYPQKTIFDSLHEDGFDFGIYYKSIPSTLFYRNLRKLKYIPKFHLYSKFKEHAKKGALPNLSVIEPRYFDVVGFPADDDHPAHDVSNGQRLVKEVYETLRSSPQWNETLFIVTYDEHGGFYDHVATPYVGVPNPDGVMGPPPFLFRFDRLGVRIPTIMISPWIKKGTVVNRPAGPNENSEFEHSSIPATIKKIFNLTSDFLTRRDAWAGTFDDIFIELSSPRADCPEKLPEVFPLRAGQPNENSWLSEFQSELVELAAVLNGDYQLNSFGHETNTQMTVKQAHSYVKQAVERYLQVSREAIRLGADESASVSMKSSLTSVQNSRSTP